MKRGYILVETLTAMTILSVSILAINGAMRQAAWTKAMARDFTHARFVLEQVVGTVELQQLVAPGRKSGRYPEPLSQFRWEYEISMVPVPVPRVNTSGLTRGQNQSLQRLTNEQGEIELPVHQIPKVRATVSWTRMGIEFSETVETLLDPIRALQEDGS